jgi:hypothetical protein
MREHISKPETTDFHQKLKQIFAEIIDLEPNARADKVALLTNDAALARRVMALAERLDSHTARHTVNRVPNNLGDLNIQPATQNYTRNRKPDPVASILDMATGPELNVGATLGAWAACIWLNVVTAILRS